MAIGDNSYGSTGNVAILTPMYSNNNGVFDGTTNPTLANVEIQINQISGMVNVLLSEQGFAIPVSQADSKLALDGFIDQEVAAIVEGINGSGRFGPTTKSLGKSRFQLILDDIQDFVTANAVGFERLGATRTQSATSGVGFRDTNDAGVTTEPIFQREAFGNIVQDWDIAP